MGWTLTSEQMAKLDAASATPRAYPYWHQRGFTERNPPPALLVSPGDARDAVRAAILVKAMTPQLQDRARTYASRPPEKQ